jgi:hypothetical protein
VIVFTACEYLKDLFLLYFRGYRIVRAEDLVDNKGENKQKGEPPQQVEEQTKTEAVK